VKESDFNREYKKNPVNLISHSNVSKPQQRYIFTHIDAVRPSTYLGYKQCLPGSVAFKKHTSNFSVTLINNKVKFVALTNDISCKAYDAGNAEPPLCSNHSPKSTKQNGPKPATQNGPNSTTQNGPKPTTQNGPKPATQNGPNSTTQNSPEKTGNLQGTSEDGNPRAKGKTHAY
jgi:hypothetical protein